MILQQARDWLEAVHDGHPAFHTPELKELMAELAPAREGGHWEIGLDGADLFAAPELRFFGTGADVSGFSVRAVKAFGISAAARKPPPAGLPWLSFLWDMKTGKASDAFLFGAGAAAGSGVGAGKAGAEVVHAAKPFSRELFKDPAAASMLQDFAALCPIETIVSEWEVSGGRRVARERWRLRLRSPEPWPRFCRLNMADPFLSAYSELSYLGLSRRVTELAFEGGRLRVYLAA